MGRMIAPKLSEILGVPVVVENRAGAGGQIAGTFVAKSQPDGYTLMVDASSFSINPYVYPSMPYDPTKVFKTLAVLSMHPNVLLVNPAFPAQSVKDYVSMAEAKPGSIAFASSGNGSGQHMAGALFESQAKVKLLHVPYKGGGPAMNDVMAGQIPSSFGNVASSMAFIQSGRMRALGVTSKRRAPLLPNVPTMLEQGIPEYEVYEWIGVFAPAGVSPEIEKRLAVALRAAATSPEVQKRVEATGGEVFPGDNVEADKFIKEQMTQWSHLVKEKNIKVQ